jgi:uncharacterized membrane protein YjgN (DUF898 family)
MSERPSITDRFQGALVVVVLVALGLPVAAALIEPVVPTLLGIAMLVLIIKFILRGPHYRGK